MILFSKVVAAKIDELYWHPQHKHPISSTKDPSLYEEHHGAGAYVNTASFSLRCGKGEKMWRLVGIEYLSDLFSSFQLCFKQFF